MNAVITDVREVRKDLAAEQDALDAVVSELEPGEWSMQTPSAGWTINDQIGHLTYFDRTAALAHKWSYVNRGLDEPTVPVHVSLNAPSGDIWDFGPPEAVNTIAGPATEFCLVVTQRRHIDDTELTVSGDDARDWLLRAQAFAGAPTNGPAAGSR